MDPRYRSQPIGPAPSALGHLVLLAAVALMGFGCASPRSAPPTPEPPEPDDAMSIVETARSPLGSLVWLAGTWASDDPEGPRTVEYWLAPAGGTMLGVNRTVVEERTVFFEYLRIEGNDEGIAYLASPLGRDPPTRFERVAEGPQWIAFENLEHDFPQRIEYRREGSRLTMTISGQDQGEPKSSRWSLRRVGSE